MAMMKKFLSLLAVVALAFQTIMPVNVLFADEIQELKNSSGENDTGDGSDASNGM